MDKPIKILLVEDDPEDFKIFKTYLNSIKRSKFEIDRASRYDESLEIMLQKKHDIYILDYYIGQKNGLELLKEAVSKNFKRPVIFLTGRKNSDTDLEALDFGAYDYLIKDYVNPENLERSIRYALSRFHLESQLRDQKIILETIIESSPVGMCVTTESMGITHWNFQFLSMFNLDEGDTRKTLDELISFEQKKSDIYSKDYEPISSPFGRVIPNKVVSFEGKVTGNGVCVHCMVKYKSILIKNGKDRIYKVFSFINTDRYRERENQLRDTVDEAERLIKKYAEQALDPAAYMDLADLEVTKLAHGMKADALGV